MKTLFAFIPFVLMPITADVQTFQLKFATFEKYITQNYTLEKVKTAIASSYSLVKEGDTEWKFRDDSKSWEALVYVQFDKTTKKITQIQFTAPNNRVYELMDELEKKLGYKLVGTEGQTDIYKNTTKKLGAKIVPSEFLGPGIVLFNIYRL